MVVLMGLRMCCGMLEAGRVGLLNGDEVLAGLKEVDRARDACL